MRRTDGHGRPPRAYVEQGLRDAMFFSQPSRGPGAWAGRVTMDVCVLIRLFNVLI
jgi:hypothetical protein